MSKRLPALTQACALSLLACASVGVLNAETAPWAGPGFSASAKAMLDAAASVEKTKGSDATILMMDVALAIDANGRTTQRFRLVYRLDTTAALQGWAAISSAWEPWHQQRPIIRARVCTPDGVEHALDPKTLSDAPAHQESAEVYGDGRIYRGPLPAVVVGAVVEEEVLLQDTEPVFADGVLGRIFLGRRVPVLQSRLVLEAPVAAGLKYEPRLLPDAVIATTESNGIKRVTINQGKLAAIEVTDANLPPEFVYSPHVEFSTSPSWKAVVDAYLRVAEPRIRTADVQAIVAETVSATDSREDKIRKLTARLHKDVRYTGIEFGRLAVVPQPPAEVLKRKYGDCKDKAATLVAMLRAAGVPAHLALLNAGFSLDVTPSLPGANLFNHAIVYVPGSPDMWIDATDEYSPAGQLPLGDQQRNALVIRESSAALTRTPGSTGADNLLVEKREYRLSEYGPATVVEESETHGYVDRNYRSYYGVTPDAKKLQSELTDYVKYNYVSDETPKLQIGDGRDLTKPFVFRIEAAKARRGYTALSDARALVFLSAIVNRLPAALQMSDEDIKREDAKREHPRTPRTADFVLSAPFITEWRCRFVPPPGFKLRSMPDNRALDLGPAKFTARWEAASDGVVTGIVRFDTVKQRYTPSEAEALRKAVAELKKEAAVAVSYDQEGAALLAAGKGKEAIAAFDALNKLHPTEALHLVQLANALLEVGLGESARTKIDEAVRLEPKSALAHGTRSWVLQHDLVGRRFKKGFDWKGAVEEYRRALECDPEDNDIRANYAILLEHNEVGERYSATSNLAEAVVQYRKLKDAKYTWEYLDGNLAAALFWAGRWKEVETQVATLPSNDENVAMLVAARAASEGAPAGIKRAAELANGEKARSEALVAAGNKLVLSRLYPLAADLFEASNTGKSALETITAIRNTRRYEDNPAPGNDAQGAVRRLLNAIVGPSTPDAKAVELFLTEWKQDGTEGPVEMAFVKRLAQQIRNSAGSSFASDARGDVVLSNIKLSVEGDDKLGYRVLLQMMALNGLPVYVVKSGDAYKIVPSSNVSVARVVLDKLKSGDLKGARQWLDWMREERSVQGGEDPFAGPLFPRLWRRGQNGDATAIQIAAASLLEENRHVEPLLPVIKAARAKATRDQEKAHLNLILFDIYAAMKRWPDSLAAAKEVFDMYPESETAFGTTCLSALRAKQWAVIESVARSRAERVPDDELSLLMRSSSHVQQGHFQQAYDVLKARASNPKAGMALLNNCAWIGLFLRPVPADVSEIAQRGTRLSEQREFTLIHTLASVYAEIGRAAEARKLLLEGMDQSGFEEPDEAAWYVFGRIAEHYGQVDAAMAAYARTKPSLPPDEVDGSSAWALARLRARGLGKELK